MTQAAKPQAAGLAEQFLPKIVTVLREGYRASDLRADAIAGLTVAIVALPLSMAIAIASGVGPERGLFTAIVGGFLVSALGGSRYQIGGPAGAFIVLVWACVMDIGVPGLVLATFLSGFLLILAGALRLGTYIKFIPYPVTVGFTAGIAVIIFASQLKDLLGLTLPGPEPAEILHKIEVLWAARGSFSAAALGVALATIATIEAVKRFAPRLPSLLLAVTGASLLVALLGIDVETIGTRFGELPRVLPAPAIPELSGALLASAMPYAVSFTLLGAIESLLSAVVADGMSGAQHRSNAELMAQGAANIGSAIFGGFCVTGTIARTATNVRAGSRGPVSGMLHALFLLGFMLVAAPLAAYIPLASLAGVLAVVAWNMAEKQEFWLLLRSSRGDAMVLIATFLLVVFRDLTEGIVVGFALGGLVFIRRMSDAAKVEHHPTPELVDTAGAGDSDVVVYRLRGAFFFGAAATMGAALDRIARTPRAFVMDLSEVPFLDSTGARTIEMLAHKMERRGGRLYLSGANLEVRRALLAQHVREPLVRYLPDLQEAVEAARAALG